MKFVASGLSIRIVVSCMTHLLAPAVDECRSFSMNYFRQIGKLFTAIRRMVDYNLSRLGNPRWRPQPE
jgi:hypothetical protein